MTATTDSATKRTLTELLRFPVVISTIYELTQPSEVDELAVSLMHLFETERLGLKLLQPVLRIYLSSSDECKNASLLFRGLSLVSRMLSTYSRLNGTHYLESVLSKHVRKVNRQRHTPSLEIDPSKAAALSESRLAKNRAALEKLTERVLNAVLDTPLPTALLRAMRLLAHMVHASQLAHATHTALGSFLFLRFVCPAIVCPEAFLQVDGSISPEARRTLILVAKLIQTLANDAPLEKEAYLLPFAAFFARWRTRLAAHYDALLTQEVGECDDGEANEKIWNTDQAHCLAEFLRRNHFRLRRAAKLAYPLKVSQRESALQGLEAFVELVKRRAEQLREETGDKPRTRLHCADFLYTKQPCEWTQLETHFWASIEDYSTLCWLINTQKLDGRQVLALNRDQLRDYGVATVGERLRLLKEIQCMREVHSMVAERSSPVTGSLRSPSLPTLSSAMGVPGSALSISSSSESNTSSDSSRGSYRVTVDSSHSSKHASASRTTSRSGSSNSKNQNKNDDRRGKYQRRRNPAASLSTPVLPVLQRSRSE
eukprot:CAMPEP_0177664802 /NCGR_PEP_ID=MMETSP0447-20121125/20706_1 /TAXON_ID=0 /ORGANISM="Stygamoeba regulata, Strain BSH-02190019" /LENGTH=541 /DNA_ID=CAMNT_0019170835 /DNA_START=38 /DNA_END=1663 /DNA_ORIENTATION=-